MAIIPNPRHQLLDLISDLTEMSDALGLYGTERLEWVAVDDCDLINHGDWLRYWQAIADGDLDDAERYGDVGEDLRLLVAKHQAGADAHAPICAHCSGNGIITIATTRADDGRGGYAPLCDDCAREWERAPEEVRPLGGRSV